MTKVTFGRPIVPPPQPEPTAAPRSFLARVFLGNVALLAGIVTIPIVIAVGFLLHRHG